MILTNLQIFPYAVLDGGQWSLSDSVMASIWFQLEQEGKVEQLFYDGSVRDLQGWLEYVKRPGTYVLVVADLDAQKPVHVAWVKDVGDGLAWLHHVGLGQYKRGAWEVVRDYYQQTPLRILLGLTPITHRKALKITERICKWTLVGEIPDVCNLAYEGRRVPGIVSYYQLKKDGEDNGRRE